MLAEEDQGSWLQVIDKWLEAVLAAAGPSVSEERFFRIARLVHEKAGRDTDRLASWWWTARPLERCFAYAVLLTRSVVLPNRHPKKTDDMLASELGLSS